MQGEGRLNQLFHLYLTKPATFYRFSLFQPTVTLTLFFPEPIAGKNSKIVEIDDSFSVEILRQ